MLLQVKNWCHLAHLTPNMVSNKQLCWFISKHSSSPTEDSVLHVKMLRCSYDNFLLFSSHQYTGERARMFCLAIWPWTMKPLQRRARKNNIFVLECRSVIACKFYSMMKKNVKKHPIWQERKRYYISAQHALHRRKIQIQMLVWVQAQGGGISFRQIGHEFIGNFTGNFSAVAENAPAAAHM